MGCYPNPETTCPDTLVGLHMPVCLPACHCLLLPSIACHCLLVLVGGAGVEGAVAAISECCRGGRHVVMQHLWGEQGWRGL